MYEIKILLLLLLLSLSVTFRSRFRRFPASQAHYTVKARHISGRDGQTPRVTKCGRKLLKKGEMLLFRD